MKQKGEEERIFNAVISRVIRKRRSDLGMNQETLAEKIGVRRCTIIEWEKGASTPHSFDLYNLFRHLGPFDDSFFKALDDEIQQRIKPIQMAADRKKAIDYIERTKQRI